MTSEALCLFIFLPVFSPSQEKTSFSVSELLCWPPPGFPPSLHLFPPTFSGSLTSIFAVSCCSGQHFFFNRTPLWRIFTEISSYFHSFTIRCILYYAVSRDLVLCCIQGYSIVQDPKLFLGVVNANMPSPLTMVGRQLVSVKAEGNHTYLLSRSRVRDHD